MTIIFKVQEEVEGGYSAHAEGLPVFTQGDDFEELKRNVKDALDCYFEAPFRGVMDMVLSEKVG